MIAASAIAAMVGALAAPALAQTDEIERMSRATRQALAQTKTAGISATERRLRELADGGDLSAAAALGQFLFVDMADRPAEAKAACDYSEAAADAFPSARHNLATCFYEGRGRERDLERARAEYERAADAGALRSACALGNMLVRGEGGPADPEAGAAACRRGAEAGLADAETDYAIYLLEGRGVARDQETALAYLNSAYDKGHPNAAGVLGLVYLNGDGVETDLERAKTYLTAAVERGATRMILPLAGLRLRLATEGASGPEDVDLDEIAEVRDLFIAARDGSQNPAVRQRAEQGIEMLAPFLD
ncbi:MAG: tetratricopeptide repeat protein [Pseudomonadota bacterium]